MDVGADETPTLRAAPWTGSGSKAFDQILEGW